MAYGFSLFLKMSKLAGLTINRTVERETSGSMILRFQQNVLFEKDIPFEMKENVPKFACPHASRKLEDKPSRLYSSYITNCVFTGNLPPHWLKRLQAE